VRAVFDAGVVLAGAGWQHEAHRCLALAARRIVLPYATVETLEELRRVAQRMQAEGWFRRHNPWPTLNWYLRFARIVEPALLGKQRSRDVKDDPYLACALGVKAKFIISRDSDLLALGKPFGVEILTPRAFLSRVADLF
jgi:predicted nucleic acid-binding protein